jgi:hypothetical protein
MQTFNQVELFLKLWLFVVHGDGKNKWGLIIFLFNLDITLHTSSLGMGVDPFLVGLVEKIKSFNVK